MIRRLLGIGLLLWPAALWAEEETPRFLSLDAAMTGATAMTELQGAYLFIARPDGGYVCAINLNDRFFASIAQGAESTAFANQPGALCATARFFEDLLGPPKEKL